MKYAVLWSPAAETELAALYLSADNRSEITTAAHAIDSLLGTDAHLQGESRQGTERIAFVSPLGVYFEAKPDERTALVLHIWRTR